MKKQRYIKQSQIKNRDEEVKKETFPWMMFSMKISILFIFILLVVVFTDKKGYFTADQSNNHVRRKWASFYDYTKTKDVDVILLGNSHITTGIEPYVLSAAIGSTCYILGNAGTNLIDAWFQLGDALKHAEPKLVILETYCINNAVKPKKEVVSYFQSFDALKDNWYKLRCMPQLFDSDSWISAWSTSIRNHSFLLTDMARIHYNIEHPNLPKSKKLDLGRFARFDIGLQDSTLMKYDSIGAPIDGELYSISDFTKKYLEKIVKMCNERNIPILFLTVPMYYKHISHYDAWKSTLNDEFNKYPNAKWLDLQIPYDTTLFTPDKFENTYETNQHMSNIGMVVTAYKLAEFINNHYPGLLPDHSKDTRWINDFKKTDHFIYNQDVVSEMPGFTSIVKDRNVGNFQIKELVLQENSENNRLILKVRKQDNLPNALTVEYKITMQNSSFIVPLQMYNIKEYFPLYNKIYIADIRKDIEINDILGITLFSSEHK